MELYKWISIYYDYWNYRYTCIFTWTLSYFLLTCYSNRIIECMKDLYNKYRAAQNYLDSWRDIVVKIWKYASKSSFSRGFFAFSFNLKYFLSNCIVYKWFREWIPKFELIWMHFFLFEISFHLQDYMKKVRNIKVIIIGYQS